MAFLAVDPHTVSIPLAMLIVFGAAKLFAEVLERMGQPGIVGEILAGAVVGPSMLGWIEPNEVLTALSELGVMFLLFRVGLEVKSSELMKVGGTAFVVALLGVVAPMAMGWGIMRAWGYPQVESFFVGAAMVATSVGITAQVLAAKGLLHLVSAKIILGAAVIDDILGLIVLAIVSSAAKGHVNIAEISATALLAIGFTIIVAKWGTQTMTRLVPHAESRLKSGEAQFNIALVLLFALSVLAMYVGSRQSSERFWPAWLWPNPLLNVYTIWRTALLNSWFRSSLRGSVFTWTLQPSRTESLLILALVILAAAVISKLIGCGLGAIRLGRKEMMRIGCGMVPRGEVGMVVAQLGLSMAVIEKPVYSVVVFMAVATTIAAPALLNLAYAGEKPKDVEEQFQLG